MQIQEEKKGIVYSYLKGGNLVKGGDCRWWCLPKTVVEIPLRLTLANEEEKGMEESERDEGRE